MCGPLSKWYLITPFLPRWLPLLKIITTNTTRFYPCSATNIIYNAFFYLFQDSELTELRTTIEALKRQSGLNIPDPTIISPNVGRRHTSPGMVAKVDIHSSPNHQTHQHHQHHHHHTQGGRAFHTLPMPAGNITWTVLTNQCCHCTVV